MSSSYIRTSCDGSTFIFQCNINAHGRYLAVTEFGGGGRQGILIILEEVEGKGMEEDGLGA